MHKVARRLKLEAQGAAAIASALREVRKQITAIVLQAIGLTALLRWLLERLLAG